MHEIKHHLRLVTHHIMRAISNPKQLASARLEVLRLSDNIIGTLRAKEVHVAVSIGNWEVYVWISKSVKTQH